MFWLAENTSLEKMIKAIGFGKRVAEYYESDISAVFYSTDGLVIAVDTKSQAEQEIELTISFEWVRGFRYLDEGDLAYYWGCEQFNDAFHVYEITEGGWSSGESLEADMLGISREISGSEWFVVTNNGCLSVISDVEPMTRCESDYFKR